MATMAAVIVWTWLLGGFVSVSIMRVRAGVGFWRGLRIFGPDGFGPGWATTVVISSMFWPITLVIWLARGCPEPRTVFNHKADERRAAARRAGRR